MQHTALLRSYTTRRTGDRDCFAVRSLIFIWIHCDKTSRKTVSFRTLSAPSTGNSRPYRTTVRNRAYHQLMDAGNAVVGKVVFRCRVTQALVKCKSTWAY